jgi:sugar transferase (PEP-CTERM/EpsH1 system associated)
VKILMVSPEFPFPLDRGSKIRIFHILKELSKGNEIIFVSLINDQLEDKDLQELRKYCKELYYFHNKRTRWGTILKSLFSMKPYRFVRFHNKDLLLKLDELMDHHHFDVIWNHYYLNIAFYLSKKNRNKKSKWVMDLQNADELMWKRFMKGGNILIKFFSWLNIKKLILFQRSHYKNLDVISAVSEKEKSFFEKFIKGSGETWILPNGVDLTHFENSVTKQDYSESNIIFTGSMDITMNIDAVKRFSLEIFPIVKKEIPDARFWIVGRNPGRMIRKLHDPPHINVTGTVPDIRPYYENATLLVAPFRFGAGTKLKILESMAMGIPIVSTKVGCQGIKAVAGEHLYIRDDNESFAQGIIDLLKDQEKISQMSEKARKFVVEKYSWEKIILDIERRLTRLNIN